VYLPSGDRLGLGRRDQIVDRVWVAHLGAELAQTGSTRRRASREPAIAVAVITESG